MDGEREKEVRVNEDEKGGGCVKMTWGKLPYHTVSGNGLEPRSVEETLPPLPPLPPQYHDTAHSPNPLTYCTSLVDT